jgi:hypothetical protein
MRKVALCLGIAFVFASAFVGCQSSSQRELSRAEGDFYDAAKSAVWCGYASYAVTTKIFDIRVKTGKYPTIKESLFADGPIYYWYPKNGIYVEECVRPEDFTLSPKSSLKDGKATYVVQILHQGKLHELSWDLSKEHVSPGFVKEMKAYLASDRQNFFDQNSKR